MSAMLFAACGDQMSNNKNTNEMTELNLTQEWDKTFPKSENVNHTKVTFRNRYGIELAADMYAPKITSGKMPAIAASGPFGAVKEQSSGLYAQHLAERGFITVASTMYDMSKVNVEGYFGSENTPEQRMEKLRQKFVDFHPHRQN